MTEVGVLAVMVAVLVPKCTAVAPARLVPVMVTVVPPPVDPWLGEMGMVLLLRCGVGVGMTNRDRTAASAAMVDLGLPGGAFGRYVGRAVRCSR